MAESGNINSLNIKLTADPEGLRRGLDTAVKAMQAGGDKMQQQSNRLTNAMKGWQKSIDDAGVAATRKQRSLFNLAMGYEQMGKSGKAALKETLTAARENKDAIEDMQMAIKAGTIEGKFQMAARAMQEVTQVMAGAQGAMMAFGMSTEDTQAAMAKLHGLMAMSQGIGALMGLDGAIKALIPSLGAATAGLKGMKAALASTGIGLAAVAIGYIVVEMLDWIDTTDDLAEAQANAKKEAESFLTSYRNFMTDAKTVYDSYLLELEAGGATEKELHAEKIKQMKALAEGLESQKGMEHEAWQARLEIIDEENRYKIKQNKEAEAQRQKQAEANKKRIAELKAEREQIKFLGQNLGDLKSKGIGTIGGDQKPIALPVEMKLDQAGSGQLGKRVQMQVDALNAGISNSMSGMVDNVSNLITDMFASPETAFKNFGNAMLATLAQFMSTLGKAIIAAGTASSVFQKALLANPVAAIAAGAALVAAGAAVTGIMKRGVNNGNNQGGEGGGNDAPAGIRPFATGGIISGPTLGLMGEYPGARSNPEVVAPLDKLRSMLQPSGGGNLIARISGQDLLVMLDKAETYRGRVR